MMQGKIDELKNKVAGMDETQIDNLSSLAHAQSKLLDLLTGEVLALKDRMALVEIQIDEIINALVILPGAVDLLTRKYLQDVVDRLRKNRGSCKLES